MIRFNTIKKETIHRVGCTSDETLVEELVEWCSRGCYHLSWWGLPCSAKPPWAPHPRKNNLHTTNY